MHLVRKLFPTKPHNSQEEYNQEQQDLVRKTVSCHVILITRKTGVHHKPEILEVRNLESNFNRKGMWNWSSRISTMAGPAKTTNLRNSKSEVLTVAGPAKTISLAICTSKILPMAGPAETTALQSGVPGF